MNNRLAKCDSYSCDSLFFDVPFPLYILYNYIYIN